MLARDGNELQGSNACVIRPGKIDRSPTGTGCSARIATLSARGLMTEGDVYRARSIIGSEFVCRTAIGRQPAIVPVISGRAWITGVSQYMLDPADPWPSGYRLADTWPPLRGERERFARFALSLGAKWQWNTHLTTFCRFPKPILIISPEAWRKTVKTWTPTR
jgi:Proline racemase